MSEKPIELTGQDLTIEDVINVAENGYEVQMSQEVISKIKNGRAKLIKQIIDNKTKHIPIYGTNVGCGDLKDVKINQRDNIREEDFEDYQERYIKVHNCGTGNPLPIKIVRAIMLIRLNSFAKGLSGMQLKTCQLLVDMLNSKVTPWVLEEGSAGASGDLVPLAMISAVMIQLPEAKFYVAPSDYYNNPQKFKLEPLTIQYAIENNKLPPVLERNKDFKLGAKEAMGLTNGSNFIAGISIFIIRDAERILKTASISTALSLEAIRGEKKAFGTLVNENSDRQQGQIEIAKQIRNLLQDSKRTTKEAQEYENFVEEHKRAYVKNEERVQDRYSFRCSPQVHGATYDALNNIKTIIKKEINSATDNPLFDFENMDTIKDNKGNKLEILRFASGGNFHGQLLAAPIDYLKITLTSLGLASDKRTFSLLDKYLSYGLSSNLAVEDENGKNVYGNSGYMITQYAGAARAAENRVLSTPASVMSISTAANQEDIVSMGSIGAIHCRKILSNCQIILAIELLCATRALQLTIDKLPEDLQQLGNGTNKIFQKLKIILGEYKEDNYIRTEIEKLVNIVNSGELVDLVSEILSNKNL